MLSRPHGCGKFSPLRAKRANRHSRSSTSIARTSRAQRGFQCKASAEVEGDSNNETSVSRRSTLAAIAATPVLLTQVGTALLPSRALAEEAEFVAAEGAFGAAFPPTDVTLTQPAPPDYGDLATSTASSSEPDSNDSDASSVSSASSSEEDFGDVTSERVAVDESEAVGGSGTGPRITKKVYLDVSVAGEPVGRLVVGLYGEVRSDESSSDGAQLCMAGLRSGNLIPKTWPRINRGVWVFGNSTTNPAQSCKQDCILGLVRFLNMQLMKNLPS